MPLLCLSYILINVFDDLSLSYLQRHIVRNHQMSHLRTPEMIHFPFVLILFLNKHWVLNVKPECKTDHVSVCAVSIDTQRPQCGKKKKIDIQVCRRKQLQFQFPPCMYFIGCNKMFHSLTLLIGLILVSALCSPSQRTRLIVTWTRVNASRYFDDLQPSLTENK